MKLRAQILIDIDADDFVAAADHQRRIEAIVGDIKQSYRQAELMFRERRPRALAGEAEVMLARQGTGALNRYEDL